MEESVLQRGKLDTRDIVKSNANKQRVYVENKQTNYEIVQS